MLDDTAMDFLQGQNVKLLIDILGNIKVWVNSTLHFKNLIHWYIIEKMIQKAFWVRFFLIEFFNNINFFGIICKIFLKER